MTESGCSPVALAEHVTTSGTEDSSTWPCTGPPRGSPAGTEGPPADRVKPRFHPGEEIPPRQKTERPARLPQGPGHLESAVSHGCGLENQCLAQMYFEAELWCALRSKQNELLETGHAAPLHLPSKFSISVFATSKVVQLPTQRESRTVVSKDNEHLVGVLRARLAQGATHKTVSLPRLKTGVGKQAWRAPMVSHRSAFQAQAAATRHIWHGDGRLGPAGRVESSSP